MGRAVRPRVRAGRGRGRPAARGNRAPSVPGRLAPPADHRSVLEPGGAAVVRGRAAHRSNPNRGPRRRGVSQELRAPRRNQRRRARPDRVAAQLVLRGDEVREALGAMFSLHIDTARTWRGGQNQVLLTVLGLRARGHRGSALRASPRACAAGGRPGRDAVGARAQIHPDAREQEQLLDPRRDVGIDDLRHMSVRGVHPSGDVRPSGSR